MEAEPKMLLHNNSEHVAVVAQELKHSLKHTTSTTAACTAASSSLECVVQLNLKKKNI